MTEQEKREKVIEALEACVLKDPDDSRDCKHCPRCNYGAFITNSCINGVMSDALALLKAQEPRVMTVNEISALDNGSVVWIEFTDERLLPMIVEDGVLMRWKYLWRICEDAFRDEDYRARAWTSRPTDEVRMATPWRS